jgi:multidrug resistance efflux pump
LLPPENATGNFVKVVQRLPVRIELEAYDPNDVTSQQEPIAAARQHLALLPPENATGNFVKVVQRLPVRIELEAYDPNENPLFVGTSVVPYVYLNKPLTGPDAGKFLQTVAPQSQTVGPSQSSIGAHK